MKTVYAMTAALLALSASAAVQAQTTLTFDSLTQYQYGDGAGFGDGVGGDNQNLTYTESGYVLTLHTANGLACTDGYCYGAHIGDGTGVAQTFNWHDQGDNQYGAYVTLTKVGGGAFNLLSFDYLESGTGISVTSGANSLWLDAYTSGTATANFFGVTSVSFVSNDYSGNQLDNIRVAGVPEPASWAMMLGGFGLVGGAMRSRRKVVSFA